MEGDKKKNKKKKYVFLQRIENKIFVSVRSTTGDISGAGYCLFDSFYSFIRPGLEPTI
jgi:hypothetical protein